MIKTYTSSLWCLQQHPFDFICRVGEYISKSLVSLSLCGERLDRQDIAGLFERGGMSWAIPVKLNLLSYFFALIKDQIAQFVLLKNRIKRVGGGIYTI